MFGHNGHRNKERCSLGYPALHPIEAWLGHGTSLGPKRVSARHMKDIPDTPIPGFRAPPEKPSLAFARANYDTHPRCKSHNGSPRTSGYGAAMPHVSAE